MKKPSFIKSQDEKRMERRININQALNNIKQQIKKLEKDEQGFIEDARKAHREGLNEQYKLAFAALKRTEQKIKFLKQVHLNFKIAVREEEQMNAYNKFAEGVMNLSKSMEELFDSAQMEQVHSKFSQAMERAQSMEERMRLIVDSSSEVITEGLDVEDVDEQIADEDIEQLIKGEAAHEDEEAFDSEIEQGLEEIKQLRDKS